MARRKIEFTEEQNELLKALSSSGKKLEDIVKLFNEEYGTEYAYSTIFKQIKSLNLKREDNRKYNGDWKDGIVRTEVVKSASNPLSKYKIKKYDQNSFADKEEAKRVGYGKDGNPLNFSVVRGRDGDIDVRLNINETHLSFQGGDVCKKGSIRWWVTERARFDYGDKYHPLLPGQNKGDWRGVVNRLLYDGDGYLRLNDIDIITEQQEAWERYVDAYYEYAVEYAKELPNKLVDNDSHNIFLINQMDGTTFNEMLKEAPDVVYKYIPNYIYGAVICWCLDKMMDDNRISTDDYNIVKTLRNIVRFISMDGDLNDCDRISLASIQRCLDYHPNDYDLIIRNVCMSSISRGLISYKYKDALFDICSKLTFKGARNEYLMTEGVDHFDLYSGKVSILSIIMRRDNQLKEFCEMTGLRM